MNPEEFFEVIEENPCENCILYKKKYSLGLQETIFKYKKGFPEIVVILDNTPLENSLYLHLLHKLNLYFSNFWVLSGLKCQIKSNVTFPSPVYEAYKECNCICCWKPYQELSW
jgi:hypothetical protein